MARQRNRSGKSKQTPQKQKEKKIEPRLPASLLRELGQPTNKRRRDQAKEEKKKQVDDKNEDLYEYEEGVPEEESGKNRRFDNVDSHEYTLPPDFEDEEVDEDVETEDERGSESGFEEGIDGLDDSFEGGTEASEDDHEQRHGGEEQEDNEDEDDDGDGDEDDDDDDERHRRMIELVTGKQADKAEEKKGRKNMLLSEAYPESEYNLNPSAGDDGKEITVEDLMSSLQDTTGFGALRKRMRQLEKKGALVQAPLAKCEMDKLERKAGYEEVKKDVTRWMPIVKKNREAPTVVYNQRPTVPVSNVAVLAAHFHPTSNFEKEISSLLHRTGTHDPRKVEEAEVLALNKMTVEEVRERQERLSKMRSLLFQHEIKAKRIKKIKSKTYHKLLQKSKRSKARSLFDTDPDVLKDEAMKQEFKRAQERMTLKHKNTSKWAKRVLKRGLDKHQDDGTKDAIAEQLRAHALLTQKIHSATLSSDESDSEDEQSDGDEVSGLVLEKKPGSKILARAKVETLKALEGDEEAEIPTSGLFALPFMVRAIEKKRKEAQGDASQLLKQLENAEDDDDGDFMDSKYTTVGVTSGQGPRIYGDVPPSKRGNLSKSSPYDDADKESNSEDEGLSGDELSLETGKCLLNNMVDSRTNSCSAENAQLHGEEDEDNHGLMNPAVAHSTQTSGPITVAPATSQGGQDGTGSTHLADILACSKVNNTHKKQKVSKTGPEASVRNSIFQTNPMILGDAKMVSLKPEDEPQVKIAGKRSRKKSKKTKIGHNSTGHESIRSDTINNADHALVRGLPTEIQQTRHTHEINGDAMPFNNDGLVDAGENDENIGLFHSNEFIMGMESQSELIKQAFAGDDVEEEFEAAKAEVLNEEVPRGESDKILPGWGQWTDVQKKKGQPTWLVKQQEDLEQQRGKALTKRKDAKLKHVIISEKMDKKANKFMSASLPFPYTSKDVFEKTLRMPIGREYNTDEAFRNMIRPSEIKSTGLVIAPINYRLKEKDDDALTSTRENEHRSRGQKNIDGPTLKRKHAVGSKDDGFLSLKSLKRSQTQPVK